MMKIYKEGNLNNPIEKQSKVMNRKLIENYMQMIHKHLKRWLISFVTRKMHTDRPNKQIFKILISSKCGWK